MSGSSLVRGAPVRLMCVMAAIAVIGMLLLPPAARAESPPVVADVSLRRGPTGGGATVQISGSGLSGAMGVRFGASTPATSFTVESDQIIHAVVPAHAAGLVNVFVDTPGGTNPSKPSSWYHYLAPPVVTSVSPTAGPRNGGNEVTINGAGLLYTRQVRFGPALCCGQEISPQVTVIDDSQIIARAPSLSGGLVNIRVDTPGGTNANQPSSWYRFVDPPTVTKVSPNRGPTSGGNTVVINGGPFTDVVGVSFGQTCFFAVCSPVPATSFTVESDTQITAVAPPGAARLICVKVETSAGGTSPGGSSCWYTYQ